MNGLSIELARHEDFSSILRLATDCIDAMRAQGIEQWDEVYPNKGTFDDDMRNGTLYVCRFDGRVLGCGVLNSLQEPEYVSIAWHHTAEPIGVVHRLMIDPTMWGKGTARFFMGFMEKRALSLGYRSIRLDAFAQNFGALGLYERLGYRRSGLVRFRWTAPRTSDEFNC
jgi:GNAT superfamily N-acetyltransferase